MAVEVVQLGNEFCKDLNCFHAYMPYRNRVFIIHEYSTVLIPIFVDACSTGAAIICEWQAYHAKFPVHIIREKHPIGHLETLNAGAPIKTWAPIL